MSYLKLCDICGNVFKPGDKKILFATQEVEETKDQKIASAEEYYAKMQKSYNTPIEYKEICKTCKIVFDNIIALRKSQAEAMLKSIRESLEKTPETTKKRKTKKKKEDANYCSCLIPVIEFVGSPAEFYCMLCKKKVKYDFNINQE